MALTQVQTQMLGTGAVLQVVNATYSTQVSTSSTSLTDTGLSATITPKFSTSKILVIATNAGLYKNAVDTSANYFLIRASTNLIQFGRYVAGTGTASTNLVPSVSISYLDSPATTSAITYKTQFTCDSGAGIVYVQFGSGTFPASTITLMEIAG
jgi:hypothetical protein